MAGGRCIELDYTFQQRARLGQKPPGLFTAALPVGFRGQPDLGLCELVQGARVGEDAVPGAFEVPMCEAGIPGAASQDGRIDGILAEYQSLGALQQP